MDWTSEKAREAEATLRKIAQFLALDPLSKPWVSLEHAKPPQEFVEALANDLNTSQALTLVGKYLKEMDEFSLVGALRLLGFKEDVLKEKFASFEFRAWDNDTNSGHSQTANGEDASRWHDLLINLGNELHRLRQLAMASKDFSEVDRFKSALTAAGVEVRMSKVDVNLTPGANFDPAKLESLK